MYKSLDILRSLTGSFGHETQDIISKIGNNIAYLEALKQTIENRNFGNITGVLKNLHSSCNTAEEQKLHRNVIVKFKILQRDEKETGAVKPA